MNRTIVMHFRDDKKYAKKIGHLINSLSPLERRKFLKKMLKDEFPLVYFMDIEPSYLFFKDAAEAKRQDIIYVLVKKIDIDTFEDWVDRFSKEKRRKET